MALLAPAICLAGAAPSTVCSKTVLEGQAAAAQEWKAQIGEGWLFRVLPIDSSKTAPGNTAYSGWDLVVDREQPAGFPDALLLATPPYNSINQREIGTTFGVRAQDAIGWNPRSFRFFIHPAEFHHAQQLFSQLGPDGRGGGAAEALMQLSRGSGTGQFRILDARLTPGIADAAPFAENWWLQSAKTPHTLEPAPGGKSSPLGRLGWIRFSITLWLPPTWKLPPGLAATREACPE